MYFQRKEQTAIQITYSRIALDIKDLPLLLLPTATIARYLLLNRDVLTIFQGILIFFMFLAIAFTLTFVVPLAFRFIGSKTFLMMTGLSFSFVIFNMASLTSDFNWNLVGRLRIQIPLLLLLAFILIIMYSRYRAYLHIVAPIFFIAVFVFTLVRSSSNEETTSNEIQNPSGNSNLYEIVMEREPLYKPNIFLLTYESYVENETMLQYGIDNTEQEKFLLDNGFHIYRGNWTVGNYTLYSLDAVLNVSHLSEDHTGTSGNGIVHNILSKANYKTYGVFPYDYFFRGVGTSYDHSFPNPIPTNMLLMFPRQILEGQFRFEAELEFDQPPYPDYLSEKRAVLAKNNEYPIFLFSHSLYPGHSQNSGQALGDEVEIYRTGLVKANEEMREDVTTAIKNNPDSIIIVGGDHGPYLTKNCHGTGHQGQYPIEEINRLDIQDRYGSFLAIRWPKEANINHEDINILQDIFPVIFTWMYDDPEILNTRIEQYNVNADFTTSGALVVNGVIKGGIDDGKPLFESKPKK